MYAESHRPVFLDDVIGHQEIKESLKQYLTSTVFPGAIFLIGPPGIGKTTMALCAARTFSFDPLEINASRSIRSFEDVDKLKDACRSSVNIQSFLRGEPTRKTCVILDEVDGSDPHAQAKIVDWMKDSGRTVPIVCTGNELPTIFKRNANLIQIMRCYPPKAYDVQHLFPHSDAISLLKECQHDIRRVFHRLQYGVSYVLPSYSLPPTGTSVEKAFLWRQRMFGLQDPLEYLCGKPGIYSLPETKSECSADDKRVGTHEAARHRKQSALGKSSKTGQKKLKGPAARKQSEQA